MALHMAKLTLDGVTKSFGSKQVLRGLDLIVGEHEVVCLIGPSGCGKSTALRCIDLLEPIDSGQILLDGTDISARGVKANDVRRRIGIVFQSFNLFPHLSVLDNVTLGARRARGVKKRDAEARALDLLGQFGLADRAADYPNKLSGGQNQRAAIVRALMGDPELLLLDEVTSALDPELVGEVLGVIRDLAAGGMTMVLATHEMGFAKEVAHRVCFLHEGRVLEEGPPHEVLRSPTQERTQRFLARVIEAGRLDAPSVARMPDAGRSPKLGPARSGPPSGSGAGIGVAAGGVAAGGVAAGAGGVIAPPFDPTLPPGVREVDDPLELARFFADDLRLHIYAVADLCEPFWSASTWWRRDDAVVGLVGLPQSDQQVVYAVSSRAPGATLELVSDLLPRFGPGTLITGPVGLGDLLGRRGAVAWHRAYHRFWLAPDVELPPPSDLDEPLGPDDAPRLEALYSVQPGVSFFLPSMLDDGTFVGRFVGPELVAAAGTHVVLDHFGLQAAAIGAVFTHPAHRERDLARQLTIGVCHRLRQLSRNPVAPIVIGLNCAESNDWARRIYLRLGFEALMRYEEAQLSSAEARPPVVQ